LGRGAGLRVRAPAEEGGRRNMPKKKCLKCIEIKAALQDAYDIAVGWLEEFTCDYSEEFKKVVMSELEELPALMAEFSDCEALQNAIGARLAENPIDPLDMHEILANIEMDSDDYRDLHKNDGELQVIGVVAHVAGLEELADKAHRAVYST
jgi:hypothetical protein